MMRAILRRLRADRRGNTLQFALTLPLWLTIIFGVINTGRFYWIRAGLQNGLGEAARTATLWPSRTDTEIRTAFSSRVFGIPTSQMPTLNITSGTTNGQNYVDLSVSYNPQFWLVAVTVSPVTLSYTRRAYRPVS